MQTESINAQPFAHANAVDSGQLTEKATLAYFGWRDMIFIVAALAVAITVARLGMTTWADGNRTEALKSQGEAVASWMTEQGKLRESAQTTELVSCALADTTWSECRDAMVAANGPFADLRNPFSGRSPVFSSSCDRTRPDTQGSLILEKGTPKPPDGSSFAYSALSDEEPLLEPLPLRLSVCGRGFSVIHVAEFRF